MVFKYTELLEVNKTVVSLCIHTVDNALFNYAVFFPARNNSKIRSDLMPVRSGVYLMYLLFLCMPAHFV